MSNIEYLANQLNHLHAQLREFVPFANATEGSNEEIYLINLLALSECTESSETFYDEGQALLCKLASQYPQLTHLANRDLFWLLGGDCLHFMEDAEIESFQAMEDLIYESKGSLSREDAFKQTFKLNS